MMKKWTKITWLNLLKMLMLIFMLLSVFWIKQNIQKDHSKKSLDLIFGE